MSRRKKTTTTTTPQPAIRFRSRILFVLALAVGMVWVWLTSKPQVEPAEYRSLEEIAAESMSQGFEILESPDLPGPYRWLDTRVLSAGAQGRVTAGGTTRTYTVPDQANREYLAVYLTTRDDRPTYALLARDKPDPEKQEQEKKKLRESLENQGP
jgi:hypothetical protein